MAFRFKFETLLKVRKIWENMALQAFSLAQRQHLALLAMKTQIESRRDGLRHDLMNKMKGGLNSSEVKSYYDYLFHLEEGIERLQENISSAEQQVNLKRKELLKTKRAYKAIARLKEIDQARYDTLERKADMNFIDEIAILRHGGER
jgi:flagellar export protein FliJ